MFEGMAQAKPEAASTTSIEKSSMPPMQLLSGTSDQLLSYAAQSLQECLVAQEQLLAKSPDFPDKMMVANCTRVALMFFDQMALCLMHRASSQAKGMAPAADLAHRRSAAR